MLSVYADYGKPRNASAGMSSKPKTAVNVSGEFRRMANLKGSAYRAARSHLLSMGNKIVTLLDEKISQSSSPEEKLRARILKTRIEKPRLAAQVDEIVEKARRKGTRKSKDDISTLYLQSKLVQLDDIPVLPVLEHILYEQQDEQMVSALIQAVAVFKHSDLHAPFKKILQENQQHVIRMGVIDAIQRAGFSDLIPEVLSLYESTVDKKERKRILRAVRIIGPREMSKDIKKIMSREVDSELKKQLQETYTILNRKK